MVDKQTRDRRVSQAERIAETQYTARELVDMYQRDPNEFKAVWKKRDGKNYSKDSLRGQYSLIKQVADNEDDVKSDAEQKAKALLDIFEDTRSEFINPPEAPEVPETDIEEVQEDDFYDSGYTAPDEEEEEEYYPDEEESEYEYPEEDEEDDYLSDEEMEELEREEAEADQEEDEDKDYSDPIDGARATALRTWIYTRDVPVPPEALNVQVKNWDNLPKETKESLSKTARKVWNKRGEYKQKTLDDFGGYD